MESKDIDKVAKEVANMLPTILQVLMESDLDMSILKKKPTPRRRIQITKMTKGIWKFLSEQEIYNFIRVDEEGLEENLKKMYAHLPKKIIDQMFADCIPDVDELDRIDGIMRIPEPDEVPLFSLFGGSRLVVTLPNKIKREKRTGDRYVPKPLLPYTGAKYIERGEV